MKKLWIGFFLLFCIDNYVVAASDVDEKETHIQIKPMDQSGHTVCPTNFQELVNAYSDEAPHCTLKELQNSTTVKDYMRKLQQEQPGAYHNYVTMYKASSTKELIYKLIIDIKDEELCNTRKDLQYMQNGLTILSMLSGGVGVGLIIKALSQWGI